MYYIESSKTDPSWNLALEEYAFEALGNQGGLFMLWQNENAVIIGKHQNTFAEVCGAEIKRRNTKVVRRLSGGGAVYHDLGNVNFTFVLAEKSGMSFATFCKPVQEALAALGVEANLSGRNDMTIDGKKFSGNSQYRKKGVIMHHGTLLFDTDLDVVNAVLRPNQEKLAHKGLKSVRSRVTNIKPYLKKPMDTADFLSFLRAHMSNALSLIPYDLSEEDESRIRALSKQRYESWEWNYGSSPSHQATFSKRFEGVGRVDVYLTAQNGCIGEIKFFGDFFEGNPVAELEEQLTGCQLKRETLLAVDPAEYILHFQREQLAELLLGEE